MLAHIARLTTKTVTDSRTATQHNPLAVPEYPELLSVKSGMSAPPRTGPRNVGWRFVLRRQFHIDLPTRTAIKVCPLYVDEHVDDCVASVFELPFKVWSLSNTPKDH